MMQPYRKWLLNLLRLVISVACIVLAVRLIEWDKFWGILRRVDRVMLAWLAPLLVVQFLVLAWRWRLLLRANGFDVPYRRTFALTYVGAFFSQFLPGAVGGDIARMVLAARDEERKAAAAGTVLLDRSIGLASLIMMATVAVVPVVRDERLRVPVVVVLSLFGAMVVGYFVYFNRALRESSLGRWLKERVPFVRHVREVDGVLKSVAQSPRILAAALLQSALAQVTVVGVAYGMSRALGLHIGLLPFIIFEVIIFILTAVPLSLGGWGVQEVAYAQLFSIVGVAPSEAVALSILLKLSIIAVALPGGIMFAMGAHRTVPPPPVSK